MATETKKSNVKGTKKVVSTTKKEVTKKVATKTPAKKEAVKKVAAKAPAKKEVATKVAAKAPAKKEVATKVATKAPAKKEVATKTSATKSATKSSVKKTTTTNSTSKSTTKKVVAKTPAKKTATKTTKEKPVLENEVEPKEVQLTISLNQLINLNKQINDTALFVQAILISTLIILGVCTIFIPVLSFVTEIMLALALFVMAYNNYNVFHRKGFTVLYSVIGVIVIIIGIVARIYGA